MEDFLYEASEKVKTKEDFVKFVELLEQDFIKNKKKWENPRIDMFLSAMGAWTEDIEHYYENELIFSNNEKKLPKNVPWGVFSDILMASKVYE